MAEKTYGRIKDLRVDHDLTQKQVAERLGLYLTQYQVYERGDVGKIPIDFFIDLAKLYNISIDYLAGLTNRPRTLDGKPYTISKNITINHIGDGNNINIKN
ncbi:MAG: helix-turn-helix transcriptional regulator [Ruminococcaceae bacterium]|nr:helix-turn-helix transcriptional regulator [Oscillospiraceae bacterium]